MHLFAAHVPYFWKNNTLHRVWYSLTPVFAPACRPVSYTHLDVYKRQLILADKTDVRHTRVRNSDVSTFDIHDRVNYSVKESSTIIDSTHTNIELKLKIDTSFCSVMDYFEIFLDRMILCRKAAEKLGLHFRLNINGQTLL